MIKCVYFGLRRKQEFAAGKMHAVNMGKDMRDLDILCYYYNNTRIMTTQSLSTQLSGKSLPFHPMEQTNCAQNAKEQHNNEI